MLRKLRLNHKSRKLRKQSRKYPIYGASERGDGRASNRYFKFWNLGLVCDVERDFLGGADERSRITPIAYNQTEDDLSTAKYHCQGAAGKDQTTCEAAGGTWSRQRYEPTVESGCPFCGTPNWRGDY